MATLTQVYPSLVEVAKRLDPNGGIASIAEHLSKINPFLEDVPWIEGNLPTGHRITARTALPSPTWRRLNAGVDPAMSATVQVDETCGMLEAYSKVDVDLANINGNAAAFRASEDRAFVESFGQEVTRAFLYESAFTNPERIEGLAPRYNSTTVGQTASYAFKGSNSGANCQSVWLLNWDPDRLFGIYPKGTVAGLNMEDLGKVLVPDANSKQFLAYVSRWQWKPGLCVRDFRYAVRLQWDPDDATAGASMADAGTGLLTLMQNSLSQVYQLTSNARFYMSRKSFRLLNNQLMGKQANFMEYVELGKRRVPAYLGVPIRVMDALVDETAI